MIAFGLPSIPNPLDGIKKVAGGVVDWVGDNWKSIAALGASTLVFAGVIALCVLCPVAIPGIIALAAAGFASGVTFYGVSQLLDGKGIDVKEALIQGGLSALVTVGTAGVGRLAAPAISRVAAPLTSRVLPEAVSAAIPGAVRTAATNGTIGAVFGGGLKVAENAITGRPLGEGVGDATALGAVNGLLAAPSNKLVEAASARAASRTPASSPTSAPAPAPAPSGPRVDPATVRPVDPAEYARAVQVSKQEPIVRRWDELGPLLSDDGSGGIFVADGKDPTTGFKFTRARATPSPDYFVKEVEGARILSDLGIGPEFRGVANVGGKEGYAMQRLSGGFPEDVPAGWIKPATIDDLASKMKILRDAGYEIGDFQYFVEPDGRVVIIDAGGLRPIGPGGPMFQTDRAQQQELLHLARYMPDGPEKTAILARLQPPGPSRTHGFTGALGEK